MKKLKALSICSGIEAASEAAEGLDVDVVAFAEIDDFPSAVLEYRYRGIPNLGDFTKITYEKIQEITGGTGVDVLIGGTPCQSFSIAGLREGLDSENGNLALEYLRLADRLRPRWVVWENVPGVLSSNGGRDFGTFLGALGQLGYGWAYRILDAQYFGVPQRRRRVFVVGYSGSMGRGRGAQAPDIRGLSLISGSVLFERHSLQRNPPPIREEGKEIAGGAENGAGGGDRVRTFIADTTQITSKLNYSNPKVNDPCHPLAAGAHPPLIIYNIMPQNSGKDYKAKETSISQNLTTNGNHSGNQGGTYVVQVGPSGNKHTETHPTLDTRCKDGPIRNQVGVDIVQIDPAKITYASSTGDGYWKQSPQAGTLRGRMQEGHEHLIIPYTSTVRRLTPIEAARLQGFPDRWTQIPWKKIPVSREINGEYKVKNEPTESVLAKIQSGEYLADSDIRHLSVEEAHAQSKPIAMLQVSIYKCPDGPQYKCYGNSMAVPVIRWIWKRILEVEKIQ